VWVVYGLGVIVVLVVTGRVVVCFFVVVGTFVCFLVRHFVFVFSCFLLVAGGLWCVVWVVCMLFVVDGVCSCGLVGLGVVRGGLVWLGVCCLYTFNHRVGLCGWCLVF